jgi:hypothetical protein
MNSRLQRVKQLYTKLSRHTASGGTGKLYLTKIKIYYPIIIIVTFPLVLNTTYAKSERYDLLVWYAPEDISEELPQG